MRTTVYIGPTREVINLRSNQVFIGDLPGAVTQWIANNPVVAGLFVDLDEFALISRSLTNPDSQASALIKHAKTL